MRFLSLLLILAFASVCFGQAKEGVIKSSVFDNEKLQTVSQDQARLSMSDWYDMRPINGAVDTGLITIATYWGATPPLVCKAIYNNSATVVVVKVATVNRPTPAAADTVPFKIDAYSWATKLPAIAKIFKIGATDSLIAFLQVVYP
jgi:hypothetical protein